MLCEKVTKSIPLLLNYFINCSGVVREDWVDFHLPFRKNIVTNKKNNKFARVFERNIFFQTPPSPPKFWICHWPTAIKSQAYHRRFRWGRGWNIFVWTGKFKQIFLANKENSPKRGGLTPKTPPWIRVCIKFSELGLNLF